MKNYWVIKSVLGMVQYKSSKEALLKIRAGTNRLTGKEQLI